MSLFGVLELELADEVDVSPGLDFGPLGTQEDILEVQLDVVANRQLAVNLKDFPHVTLNC